MSLAAAAAPAVREESEAAHPVEEGSSELATGLDTVTHDHGRERESPSTAPVAPHTASEDGSGSSSNDGSDQNVDVSAGGSTRAPLRIPLRAMIELSASAAGAASSAALSPPTEPAPPPPVPPRPVQQPQVPTARESQEADSSTQRAPAAASSVPRTTKVEDGKNAARSAVMAKVRANENDKLATDAQQAQNPVPGDTQEAAVGEDAHAPVIVPDALSLNWKLKVRDDVYEMTEDEPGGPMHLCERCDQPILVYGLAEPCGHVFCYTCLREAPNDCCPRCLEKLASRERISNLSSVLRCSMIDPSTQKPCYATFCERDEAKRDQLRFRFAQHMHRHHGGPEPMAPSQERRPLNRVDESQKTRRRSPGASSVGGEAASRRPSTRVHRSRSPGRTKRATQSSPSTMVVDTASRRGSMSSRAGPPPERRGSRSDSRARSPARHSRSPSRAHIRGRSAESYRKGVRYASRSRSRTRSRSRSPVRRASYNSPPFKASHHAPTHPHQAPWKDTRESLPPHHRQPAHPHHPHHPPPSARDLHHPDDRVPLAHARHGLRSPSPPPPRRPMHPRDYGHYRMPPMPQRGSHEFSPPPVAHRGPSPTAYGEPWHHVEHDRQWPAPPHYPQQQHPPPHYAARPRTPPLRGPYPDYRAPVHGHYEGRFSPPPRDVGRPGPPPPPRDYWPRSPPPQRRGPPPSDHYYPGPPMSDRDRDRRWSPPRGDGSNSGRRPPSPPINRR
eukprot:m.293052 g.293052  ORF g.293052 m.293052 type:complete len:729 (+) comp12723_c0_seq1:63-2249(+)